MAQREQTVTGSRKVKILIPPAVHEKPESIEDGGGKERRGLGGGRGEHH